MDPSLSNSMPMDPLNVTDSSPCKRRLSSLACLTSVRSDRLPSCSLWWRRCNLAVALSSRSRRDHVSCTQLSYTVRSPLSHSVDPLASSQGLIPIFKWCWNESTIFTCQERSNWQLTSVIPLLQTKTCWHSTYRSFTSVTRPFSQFLGGAWGRGYRCITQNIKKL